METLKEKLKIMIKQLSFYTLLSLTFVAGASIGYYYDFLKKNYVKENQVVFEIKDDIKLAIDDKNNLLIIKKKDGSYTIYQDSIGYMIFNLYAKNIWGQATSTNPPIN